MSSTLLSQPRPVVEGCTGAGSCWATGNQRYPVREEPHYERSGVPESSGRNILSPTEAQSSRSDYAQTGNQRGNSPLFPTFLGAGATARGEAFAVLVGVAAFIFFGEGVAAVSSSVGRVRFFGAMVGWKGVE